MGTQDATAWFQPKKGKKYSKTVQIEYRMREDNSRWIYMIGGPTGWESAEPLKMIGRGWLACFGTGHWEKCWVEEPELHRVLVEFGLREKAKPQDKVLNTRTKRGGAVISWTMMLKLQLACISTEMSVRISIYRQMLSKTSQVQERWATDLERDILVALRSVGSQPTEWDLDLCKKVTKMLYEGVKDGGPGHDLERDD